MQITASLFVDKPRDASRRAGLLISANL